MTSWEMALDRQFELKGDTQHKMVLRTLSDAGNFLTSVTVNPPADEGAGLLTVLLIEAARTGSAEDITAATGLLEGFLVGRRLI